MPVIDAAGYFNGDRFELMSDEARLYWPTFWILSNTLGRFEINYEKIVRLAFSRFKNPPTEDKVIDIIAEYRDAHLLFIYEDGNGQVWGQWDTEDRFLPDYKLAADKITPAPDPAEFDNWKKDYASYKASKSRRSKLFALLTPSKSGKASKDFQKVSETSGGLQRIPSGKGREGNGFGNGIGNGNGVGEEIVAPVIPTVQPTRPTPTIDSDLGHLTGDALQRMLDKHLYPSNPTAALARFTDVVSRAVDPRAVIPSSEKNHAAWCEYWTAQTVNTGRTPFIPTLDEFFFKGYHAKQPPSRDSPLPPAPVSRQEQERDKNLAFANEILESKRKKA